MQRPDTSHRERRRDLRPDLSRTSIASLQPVGGRHSSVYPATSGPLSRPLQPELRLQRRPPGVWASWADSTLSESFPQEERRGQGPGLALIAGGATTQPSAHPALKWACPGFAEPPKVLLADQLSAQPHRNTGEPDPFRDTSKRFAPVLPGCRLAIGSSGRDSYERWHNKPPPGAPPGMAFSPSSTHKGSPLSTRCRSADRPIRHSSVPAKHNWTCPED